jgi:hypothetical protein
MSAHDEDLEQLPHNRSEVDGEPHRDLSQIDPDLEHNKAAAEGDEVVPDAGPERSN